MTGPTPSPEGRPSGRHLPALAALLALALGVAALLAGAPRPDPPARSARSAKPQRAASVRQVTAYNVGVEEQNAGDPCIGASGDDLCALVAEGLRVCAANFVALGTVLQVEQVGECIVLDRTHRRFGERVDVAMEPDAVEAARAFGIRTLRVEVVEEGP